MCRTHQDRIHASIRSTPHPASCTCQHKWRTGLSSKHNIHGSSTHNKAEMHPCTNPAPASTPPPPPQPSPPPPGPAHRCAPAAGSSGACPAAPAWATTSLRRQLLAAGLNHAFGACHDRGSPPALLRPWLQLLLRGREGLRARPGCCHVLLCHCLHWHASAPAAAAPAVWTGPAACPLVRLADWDSYCGELPATVGDRGTGSSTAGMRKRTHAELGPGTVGNGGS